MAIQKIQAEKGLTRGEVAQLTGVGIETVRFYENEGLIEKPKRTQSGYRQYTQDFIKRIRFIQKAKDLGFSLKEISDLLTLRVDPKNSCADVKRMAEGKMENVEEKIRSLQKIKGALNKLVTACRGRGPTSDCPILEALDSNK